MMGRKRIWVLATMTIAMVMLSVTAFATPKDELPVTGVTWMDTTLKFMGAAYVFVSAVVLFLPRTLPLAQALAKYIADFKDVTADKAVKKAIAAGTIEVAGISGNVVSVRPGRGGQAGFVDLPALLIAGICGLFAIWFVSWISACAATQPACDAIHVADDACQAFIVKLPDGTTERVPSSELVKVAMAHRQARLHGVGP